MNAAKEALTAKEKEVDATKEALNAKEIELDAAKDAVKSVRTFFFTV